MTRNKTLKQKSIIRLITSMALAMILMFSTAQAAFAADYAEGTKDKPAEAKITKVLKMPAGTSTPKAGFSFKFDALEVDGVKATDTNMPVIPERKVTFDGDEKDYGSGGVKMVFKETINIIDGVKWTHAGVYEYKVTEVPGTYSTPTGVNYKDTMIDSKASYYIKVYVVNKSDNSDEVYVQYITAHMIQNDNGTTLNEASKVDPTPGNPLKDGDHSKLIFTNFYLKITGGDDPTDPKQTVLEISKTVTGTMGDHSKYFKFNVTITSPEVGAADGEKYKAYVVEDIKGVDTIATSKDNGIFSGPDNIGQYIEFTSGTVRTVSLKHGQRLAFVGLPVGTSFTVTEEAVAEYKASCVLILDGTTPEEFKNDTYETKLEIKESTIGEAKNSAAFTNDHKDVTPTGIGVDDLPYIILIAFIAIMLAGFIVYGISRNAVKNTRRDAEI